MVSITTVNKWLDTHEMAEVWVDFEQHVISRAINEWQNNCGHVLRPKDNTLNSRNFWHCTLLRLKYHLFKRFNFLAMLLLAVSGAYCIGVVRHFSNCFGHSACVWQPTNDQRRHDTAPTFFCLILTKFCTHNLCVSMQRTIEQILAKFLNITFGLSLCNSSSSAI